MRASKGPAPNPKFDTALAGILSALKAKGVEATSERRSWQYGLLKLMDTEIGVEFDGADLKFGPRSSRMRYPELKAGGYNYAKIAERLITIAAEREQDRARQRAVDERDAVAQSVAERAGIPFSEFARYNAPVYLYAASETRPLVLMMDINVNEQQVAAIAETLRACGLLPAKE